MSQAKILIAEDEPEIAASLQALLAARGYEARCAGDGPEAVALARREPPAVLLLDVRLPGLGGLEVCRALKSDPATGGIKIIVITGLGAAGEAEKALRSGADDYLVKPFDGEKLLAKIAQALKAAP